MEGRNDASPRQRGTEPLSVIRSTRCRRGDTLSHALGARRRGTGIAAADAAEISSLPTCAVAIGARTIGTALAARWRTCRHDASPHCPELKEGDMHHAEQDARPRYGSGLSRRHFFGSAAGLALGAGLSTRAVARGNPRVDASPLPIPGGVSPFGIFIHHFPVIANSTPLSALSDPSGITNFNGFVALNHVRGTGSSPGFGPLTFRADMGFMDGEYVAADGKDYQATFGFI